MQIKHILNLILFSILALVLFACGAGSDTNNASTSMAVSQTNCNQMHSTGNSCTISITFAADSTTTLSIIRPPAPYNTTASSSTCDSYIGTNTQVNGSGSCTYTITCASCTSEQTPASNLGLVFNGVNYNNQTAISY